MKAAKGILTAGVLGFAFIYFSSHFFLGPLSQYGVRYLRENGGKYGIRLLQPRYETVSLASWNAVNWREAACELHSLRSGSPLSGKAFTFHAARVRLEGLFPLGKRFRVLAEDFELSRIPGKDEKKFGASREIERVRGDFSYEFSFDLLHPRAARLQIRELLRKFSGLIHEGSIPGNLKLKSEAFFRLHKKEAVLRLQTYQEGETSLLRMNPDGVRNVSALLGEALTPAEVDLISTHPLRAPRLLEIRDEARRRADAQKERDSSYPFDAYKHVLWSYLLTREFGPAFAEEVTDAHENGAVNNTEADHRMDYQNNLRGREYALADYQENSLTRRVLKDPRVIRTPS